MKVIKMCCYLLLLFILYCMIVNNKEETTLQKLLYCNEKCHWQIIEGVHSKVYYQKQKEYAELIQRQADNYYDMIKKDFEWNKESKIDFVLFETTEEFTSSLLYKGEIPMGTYYSGVITILSPDLWQGQNESWQIKDNFLEKGPVVHEMIHFAVDDKTKGNCEQYLSEGIALYYEKKYTGFLCQSTQEQITEKQLKENFNQLDSSVAYWKSYEWIDKFVQCYGERTLQKALEQKGEKCFK